METFPYKTTNNELEEVPRVLSAQFGDGYGQESADGLNTLLQVWTLNFKETWADQALAIRDFLRARKGSERFYFVNPLGETITVKCRKGWKITPAKQGLLNIGPIVFEQVP